MDIYKIYILLREKGVESVELHAGRHQTLVQWLGLSFNIDTLIATWITMAMSSSFLLHEIDISAFEIVQM